MLDSLMGLHRNAVGEGVQMKKTRWDDDGVCPYSMCAGFCPSSLFINTRSALADCEYRHHDEDLRDEFKDLPAHKQAPIEARTLRYLESLLHDLERKLVRSRQRIENPAEEAAELQAEVC